MPGDEHRSFANDGRFLNARGENHFHVTSERNLRANAWLKERSRGEYALLGSIVESLSYQGVSGVNALTCASV